MYSLGMEFSTQSVKTVLLDLKNLSTVHTGTFDYDTTFPEYETRGGVLPSDNPKIRHTSPFMLIRALDRAFSSLNRAGFNLSLVEAIKIDAMQHCTIYTNKRFDEKIHSLDPKNDLVDLLRPTISRKTSPIWEDRSPVAEAHYLTEALKAEGGIHQLTGNRAELRFPAAQILKWAKECPDEYRDTIHIFLLSAFLTSLLTGRIAPVDTGDGWGTNLNHLDSNLPGWSQRVLTACETKVGDHGPNNMVKDKLGTMVPYDTMAGKIHHYYVEKYKINPKAVVLAGTGDNPATLMGCGGNGVVSLGSSYTVNGVMNEIIPSEMGEYNIFGYAQAKAMALSVFTNGGKVHEHFLRKYRAHSGTRILTDQDWHEYCSAAGQPLLEKNEPLLLPYLQDESVPLRKQGILRNGLGEEDGNANIRALALSQALSLKLHSDHLHDIKTICIVGGGAGNLFLRQLISDVFNSKTYMIQNAEFAAPLGCAVSGAVAALGISYEEAAKRFVNLDESSCLSPTKENIPIIQVLLYRYSALENQAGA